MGGEWSVSVVIPTFNRADLVCRAVASVLLQPAYLEEIIVVDDGSTDDTFEKIESINDSRIKYHRLEQNSGGSAAMNFGVSVAKANWVAFLDSDDIFLSDKLVNQMNFLSQAEGEEYKAISSCSEFRSLDNIGLSYQPAHGKSFGGEVTQSSAMFGVPVSLSSWIVRKESFLEIGGFDERIFKTKDRDFLIRFLANFKMAYIDLILVRRFESKSSVTSTRYPESELITLEKNKHFYDLSDRNKVAMCYEKIAVEHLRMGQSKKARRVFLKAKQVQNSRTRFIYSSLKIPDGNCGLFFITPYLVRRKLKVFLSRHLARG